VSFPTFTPRTTIHSARELTAEVIEDGIADSSDTVEYEAVAVRDGLVMLGFMRLTGLIEAGRSMSNDAFDGARELMDTELKLSLTGLTLLDDTLTKARVSLATLVNTYLVNGPGYFILTGLDPDPVQGRQALLRLAELLGTAMAQDGEGTVVREVRDRGTFIGEGHRTRYADSRLGGSLHTDGAETPFPVPDLFVLFCVRQAPVGGSLQILHIRDILRALEKEYDILSALRLPFHFDRRGDRPPDQSPTAVKSILFKHDDRPAITYLRRYIEIGHATSGIPALTRSQRAALDALDTLTRDRALLTEGKLRPGELAVFDNLSVLHGRTTFKDDPDPSKARLILRTWVRITHERRPFEGWQATSMSNS
jgi:hypothetical protein